MSDVFYIVPRPAQFEQERARILTLVRRVVPDAIVREIGSTAVQGILGKQDLDIVVLASEGTFDAIRRRLDVVFERDLDQFRDAIYQAYRVESFLDVKIQATVHGGPHDTFDAFLEALRVEPTVADGYNRLKLRWHGRPMHEYREAKSAFICAAISRRAAAGQVK
jgi:GrpB-like predicted nucleotidyltransferase (UPF0157 family)